MLDKSQFIAYNGFINQGHDPKEEELTMNTIYLMMDEKRNHALVKPGFASDLASRMKAYTTHNPEVRCISYIKTMEKSKHSVEGMFHKELMEMGYERIVGVMNGIKTEWFKISYDDPFYSALCEMGLCAFKCGKRRKNYGEFHQGA